uniref:Gelsolin-like domain-containing protein n=1 Tax=Elaeophora elaphi TaxID=1147741 RepID=A0A0R3RZH7_9BILA
MATIDDQLKGIGQQRGMEIWRIKDFALEKVPREQFGNFYIGDSYIILYANGMFIFGWEMKQARFQDEKGAAAIMTVQIDDALNGLPVQYREVQGCESSLFLSYFKDGIRYLKGGVASGFTHTIDEYENWKPKLFQCKGKRNVRCKEVECKAESLNLGDVFILDCGLKIYVWMPPKSGRLEKIKGMDQARSIRDRERVGKPEIIILDSNWDSNDDFWKILGDKKKVKSAENGGEDENYWRTANNQLTLWRVSDEKGKLSIQMVSKGNFQYNQLESKDAFVLDANNGGVYVWVGKNCTLNERKKAMEYATKYIDLQGRPKKIQVVRVLEGAEPATFIQWASTWESSKTPPFIPKLYQCSDHNGRLAIEEIYDYTQKDLDGDDVMIVDALKIIYVWIGRGANEQEKKLADEVANKYLQGDTLPRPAGAQIVKVLQGKETHEFKRIFDNWDDHIAVRCLKILQIIVPSVSIFCFYLFQGCYVICFRILSFLSV